MSLPFIKDTSRIFIDMLLPPRCAVTGEIVAHQGAVSPSAWASLAFISDPVCKQCGIPFEFEVEKTALCLSCLDRSPPYDRHRSALIYNDESRALILSFKHGDQMHLVHTFVPWMQKAVASFSDDIDCIVPVPLHYTRLLRRRYNQSALMVKVFAERSGHFAHLDLLRRDKATPPQGHLSAKDRYKNVKKAFSIAPRYCPFVKERKILLVDDVYTTGATMKACAKVLKKAGASEVYGLSLARVVKDIA